MERIRLSRLDTRLSRLTYPLTRRDAEASLSAVTLLFADGEANLGDLVGALPDGRFDSAEDLAFDLNNVLPVGAVGEPGQSEGDA